MLNKIIQWALHNRLIVVVAALALLIYGGYVATRTPVDVFPDLTAPTVSDEYGERVAVISGLNKGERVVTQGAYQIRLQELRPADAGVHSHET